MERLSDSGFHMNTCNTHVYPYRSEHSYTHANTHTLHIYMSKNFMVVLGYKVGSRLAWAT